MNVYETYELSRLLADNPYAGRGIAIGTSPCGKKAVFAYFIMGRSENSRNRVFVESGDELIIHPFDASKVSDPSLIIYSPIRVTADEKTGCKHTIVTNGDQTDTIYDAVAKGDTFEAALESRCFEPDGPNFTPRISGMLTFKDGVYSYKLSILKSADENGSACIRETFSYPSLPGVGHFISTYVTDGNPLPTFVGEPKRIVVEGSADAIAEKLWASLNPENRIALYVRAIDIETGAYESKLFNKHKA